MSKGPNRELKKFIIALIVIGLLFFGYHAVVKTRKINITILEVERGEKITTIARKISDNSVGFEVAFIGYLLLTGNIDNLQAGTYEFSSEVSIVQIADKFINGKIVPENVTVIEGQTICEIAHYLEKQSFVEKEKFFDLVGISAPQADLLDTTPREFSGTFDSKVLQSLPANASLEGYLFPDTYRIESDQPENFVKRMIDNLENKLDNFWGQIEQSEKTIHEIIIMASLLEKEVVTLEDKKMVADILWRRIEVGMPLQVDATINYITGKKNTNVTISEKEVDSFYNTYKYRGLPQGPIANPGAASIKAAIYPTPNDYWYYLSDPATGKTIFSKTHLEHIKAKNQYLR